MHNHFYAGWPDVGLMDYSKSTKNVIRLECKKCPRKFEMVSEPTGEIYGKMVISKFISFIETTEK